MKKSNKNIITLIFVFFIILLLSVSIVMANNTNSDVNNKVDKERIYYEIKYFDSEFMHLVSLLNNFNYHIDWNELEKRTEVLYRYWNSVILDLNYLDINKNYLTEFGKDLDALLVSIKMNDRASTLDRLIKLYNKLIIYSKSLKYSTYTNLLLTKYNLLISYSIIESQNWTLAHEYILKASEYLYEIVKNNGNNEYVQYNINQAYVAVKEMVNLINIKNTEIFYIKYNIAIQKLENIYL